MSVLLSVSIYLLVKEKAFSCKKSKLNFASIKEFAKISSILEVESLAKSCVYVDDCRND